jgi:hypothetical protein
MNNDLKLVGKTTIGKKTFTMADSDGTIQKNSFGLADDYYGGMLKEFRKTKNSGIMLCLDKRDNIINLAYVESNLTIEDRKLLGLPNPLTHLSVEGMQEVTYSKNQDAESFGVDDVEKENTAAALTAENLEKAEDFFSEFVSEDMKLEEPADDTAEEIDKIIKSKSKKR